MSEPKEAPDIDRKFIDAIESGETDGDLIVIGPDGKPVEMDHAMLGPDDVLPPEFRPLRPVKE